MLRFAVLCLVGSASSAATYYSNSSRTFSTILKSSPTSESSREFTSSADQYAAYILQGLVQDSATTTKSASSTLQPSTVESASPTRWNYSSSQIINPSTPAFSTSFDVTTFEPSPIITIYTDYFTKSESGSVFASAEKCWSDIVTWSSSSVSWFNAEMANRPFTFTFTSSTTTYDLTTWTSTATYYPSSVSTYKLCDGSPRVDIKPYTTTTTITQTLDSTVHPVAQDFPTFSIPQPCKPSKEQCRIWYLDSRAKELNQNVLEGKCGTPVNGLQYPCMFGIEGAVELIYFPVSVSNGNGSLCSANRSTILATATSNAPSTITSLGRTFTSGSAYISIKSLWAYEGAYQVRVGPNITDFILTLPSSDVSTLCSGTGTTRMNWADLNYPVPASAYACQDRCARFAGQNRTTPECATIWDDVNPWLAVPSQITDLDPAFSTCVVNPSYLANWWFDPPVALQEQQTAATVTQPGGAIVTTPAAPNSTPLSPTPTSTNRAEPTRPATTSAAVQSSDLPAATLSATQIESADSPMMSSLHSLSSAGSETAVEQFTDVPGDDEQPQTTAAAGISIGSEAPLDAHSSSLNVATANPSSPRNAMSSISSQISFGYNPTQSARSPGVTPSADEVPVVAQSSDSFVVGSTIGSVGVVATAGDQTNTAVFQGHGVSSSTVAVADLPSTHPPDTPEGTILAIGSLTLTASALSGDPGAVVVGAQTITPGGPVVTISGHQVLQQSSGLAAISDGVTQRLSEVHPAPTPSVLHVGSFSLTASPVSGDPNMVVIGTNVLSAGGSAATISGKIVSQGQSGLLLLPPSITSASEPQPTVLQDGSFTVTASPVGGNPNVVAVNGHTLSAGGAPATIGGSIISQASNALVVLPAPAATASHSNEEVLTGGGVTLTASVASGASNVVVISGQTLASGGSAISLNGQTITYGSGGLVIARPHTTAALSTLLSSDEGRGDSIVYGLGSFTLTAAYASDDRDALVVDGTTLSPGGDAVVVGSATLTAATDGLEIVRSGSAEAMSTVAVVNALPSVVAAQSSTSRRTSAAATYTPGVHTGNAPGATTSASSAGARGICLRWSLVSYALIFAAWILRLG